MLEKLENMLQKTQSLNFNSCDTLHSGISKTLNKSVRNSKLISTVMVYIILRPHENYKAEALERKLFIKQEGHPIQSIY